ncbi:MAG TPA: sugar transferase [Longimicrobiales bacterium]|nr:sugar transferase [Longimicrobiales bacterium]
MSWTKRIFDIALSCMGLCLCVPVLLAIAAAIQLDDGGPVLFRQERVGRGGTNFFILKFRTMRADAECVGGQLTVGDDPRTTRLGRWLRKYKLDELPQLVNVLRGEMSLVGPRPEVPRYVALYTPEQREVLRLVPGITDPASIVFREEAELLSPSNDPERMYVERIMPEKLALNREYASEANVVSDLLVILRTIGVVWW